MNRQSFGLTTKQDVEFPPTNVQNVRNSSTDHTSVYTTSVEFGDPPGVPVSPVTLSLQSSGNVRPDPDALDPQCVQLVDGQESILYDDCQSFAEALDCPSDQPVKVVAIVGNTGDGKSYTMNHAFFDGREIFATSTFQNTCTLGVWAAYVPSSNCILLDTEGMLGTAVNQNEHRRLLLKVFAVADIVIYLTKAPRLHSDMFTFLADASDSFAQHFRPDLEALAKRTGLPWSASQLGPAVIVFQETRHTDPLDTGVTEGANNAQPGIHLVFSDPGNSFAKSSVARVLRNRFQDMQRNVNSFSSLYYVGTQTKQSDTDFQPLTKLTIKLLQDSSVRASRKLEHVFCSLHLLNSKFSTNLPANNQYTFVEEYFTCPVTCDSCSTRCCLSVGHSSTHQAIICNQKQGQPSSSHCRYDSALKNKLYYCKQCYASGMKTMVIPKVGDSVLNAARYFYSGYVLECKRHGIIYQSRSLWSSNAEPEDTAGVHWEVIHVWSGEKTVLQGIHPFSQVLLDSLSLVSKQVTDLTAPPVRLLSDLFTDTVAPDYWQPNTTIRVCTLCKFEFPDPSVDGLDYETLAKQTTTVQPAGEHRSSDTGRSSKPTQPIYGTILPRSATLTPTDDQIEGDGSNPQRKVLMDTKLNNIDLIKHHCRACGRGVCGACSTASLPVQGFGSNPVRVCDDCYKKRRTRGSPTSKRLDTSVQPEQNTNNSSVYTGRKALELCSATVNSVPPIFSMIKDTVKGFGRPDYWVPDHLCKDCAVCNRLFGPSRRIHHCRACGRGVCEPCSPQRQPVPLRGLDLPYRVCSDCAQGQLTPTTTTTTTANYNNI